MNPGTPVPAPSFAEKLRFLPHLVALVGASVLSRFVQRRWPERPRTERVRPGISVLVPERGTPALLAVTIAAARAALADIDEPSQVLVVVNGAPASDYAVLAQQFPEVEWRFHAQALGFNGAIAEGLAHVRHDWVYLLNSDMRLAPDALRELLPYRLAHVFAITSQIFFEDATRRREETGWSDYHYGSELPCVYELEPEASPLARGNLYPGGGSSLFRRDVLARYVRETAVYSPFYWEDADWGVRAWCEGYEVLFCPRSHAWHGHRGTIGRLHDAATIDRIVRRNALQFDLRQGWTAQPPRELLGRIAREPLRTRRELGRPAVAWNAFRSRVRARAAARRGLRYNGIATDHYHAPPRPASDRPRVLLVSPFALFPPAHGGARRVTELLTRLSPDVDFILLGDERSLYDARAEPWLPHCTSVHLVEGRGDRKGEAPLPIESRIARHAHARLAAELRRLVAVHQPDLVQVEFMELAGLVQARGARERWLLALHDVYLDGGATDAMQRNWIARYDAVATCSAEDAALLQPIASTLIPNGAVDRRAASGPSPATRGLLFMGPFRYAPNREGIVAFLEQAWPRVRARFPDATLTVLGGADAAPASAEGRFTQPGVRLVTEFVDPAPHLAACALTINPQTGIRGSALKLVESLLAGRACVSTREGARGFGDDALSGLVQAESVAAMAEPIIALLADDARRRALERADGDRLLAYTWDGSAARQLALYRELGGRSRLR